MPPRTTTNGPRLNPNFCGYFLSPSGCIKGIRCNRRHDIQRCSCGLVLMSKYYLPHVRGKRHRDLYRQLKEREAKERGQTAQVRPRYG
jgi:helicase MOV-10